MVPIADAAAMLDELKVKVPEGESKGNQPSRYSDMILVLLTRGVENVGSHFTFDGCDASVDDVSSSGKPRPVS